MFDKQKKEDGYTLVEVVLMAMTFGSISLIVFPQFQPTVNKFRQKEAAGIVNSMIKAAQSNYALFARLPKDMGEVSKFSKFQKCNENNADTEGASVCRNSSPVDVENGFFFIRQYGN